MTRRPTPGVVLPYLLLCSPLVVLLLTTACLHNRPPVVSEPPSGPSPARSGITYTYYASATDPDADSISFRFDWGDSLDGWSPLIGCDDVIRASHAWHGSGQYAVRLQVRDSRGLESDWSAALLVTVDTVANCPPRTPKTPVGERQTAIGINCTFRTLTTDPDGDSVSYQFLWQNGDTSEWTPLLPPGTPASLEHQWQQSGVHAVRARARDSRGAVSRWSRSHPTRVAEIGTVKWRSPVRLADFACPAMDADGTIYVNCDSRGLLAINSDGTVKWQILTSALVPVSIADDSTIVAALGIETSTRICALRPDASIRWQFAAGSDIYSTPAIDRYPVTESCVIYFATVAGQLYALNYDGTLRWSTVVGPVIGSPAVGPDHTIYVCRFSDSLIAINPDGSIKWSLPVNTAAFSALAVAADGTVCLPTSEGNSEFLLALAPDGTARWRCPIGWSTVAPVIGPDGTIYVGSHAGAFYAITSSGRLRWSYATGAAISSPAAVTMNGTVIFGSADSSVHSLNAEGKLLWRLRLDEPVLNSPVTVGTDGTIYLHTGSWLYALHGNSSLAISQWPKFQHDIRNTGRQRIP